MHFAVEFQVEAEGRSDVDLRVLSLRVAFLSLAMFLVFIIPRYELGDFSVLIWKRLSYLKTGAKVD